MHILAAVSRRSVKILLLLGKQTLVCVMLSFLERSKHVHTHLCLILSHTDVLSNDKWAFHAGSFNELPVTVPFLSVVWRGGWV